MSWRKKFFYFLYLLFFTLLAAELILRVSNPFPSSVAGDMIILSSNSRKTILNKERLNGLDSQITLVRNSLGFRGPDSPKLKGFLKIFAIGGSTTECIYVTEGKTWTDILQTKMNGGPREIWLNNAGFDGHSTFGHLRLLRDYVLDLHPDLCIFLVGCNDIGRTDLNNYDNSMKQSGKSIILFLARYSRLANLFLSLYRNNLASKMQLSHNKRFSLYGNTPLHLPDTTIQRHLNNHFRTVLSYAARLNEIIRVCRSHQVEPILATQPCLLGEGKDDRTGIDLASFRLSESENGKLLWETIELYNRETAKIAQENHVLLIDLAHLLPKSSSLFYDTWHFNNEGCRAVADIIAAKLIPYIQTKYAGDRLN